MNSLHRGVLALSPRSGIFTRNVQSNASLLENLNEIRNKNPRNLEFMRIAAKPVGYHLEKPGREFWNKLKIDVSGRYVEASVTHFKNGSFITVSTKEWGLKKQLYRTKDVAAFTNVGRLLAQRCLECGITAVRCDIDSPQSTKITAFLDELKKGGVELEEPPKYVHANPWDKHRMPKPWTIEN